MTFRTPAVGGRAARRQLLAALSSLGVFAAGPAPAEAGCTTLGGSVVCDGDVSHAEVGRTLVFPHGPAGERAGEYVIRPKGSLPQALPRQPEAATPGPRPLDRPDGLADPTRGRDFGAFEFPSGPSPLGRSPAR